MKFKLFIRSKYSEDDLIELMIASGLETGVKDIYTSMGSGSYIITFRNQSVLEINNGGKPIGTKCYRISYSQSNGKIFRRYRVQLPKKLLSQLLTAVKGAIVKSELHEDKAELHL